MRAIVEWGEGGAQVTTEGRQQSAEPIFPGVPTAQSDSTSIQACDPEVRSDRWNDLLRETCEGRAAGGVDNRALKAPYEGCQHLIGSLRDRIGDRRDRFTVQRPL